MFKLIGGVVVCGFALYGLSKYLKRPVMNLVINPGTFSESGKAADGEATSEVSAVAEVDAAPATA